MSHGIDGNMRNKIVSFLDYCDILELSQVNKDFALSCAFNSCEKYAECVVAHERFPSEILHVFRRLLNAKEEELISLLIVEKIFNICGRVLVRKTLLSPCLMNLMTVYSIKNHDYNKYYVNCNDIPRQIIQHVTECRINDKYLFASARSLFDTEILITEYIHSQVDQYCLLTSADDSFVFAQHQYIVVSFDDLVAEGSNEFRILLMRIFNNAIGKIELVVDVGLAHSFPESDEQMDDFRSWVVFTDDEISIVEKFPKTIKTISFIGPNLLEIGDEFLKDFESIESLTLSNSVKRIGNNFLRNCSSLTSIHTPKTIRVIRNNFLFGCSRLTSITIPNVESIGDHFLYKCSSLTDVIIPNSVRTVGYKFLNQCTGLTTLVIPNHIADQIREFLENHHNLLGKDIIITC